MLGVGHRTIKPNEQADELLEKGFIILDLIDTEEHLDFLRTKFYEHISQLPTLPVGLRKQLSDDFALKGRLPDWFDPNTDNTGFLPYASTYYAPFRYEIEEKAKQVALPMFSSLCEKLWKDEKACYLELLPDRFMYRPNTEASNSLIEDNKWHRDIADGVATQRGDRNILFGGWVNLDSDSQLFICQPGSHKMGDDIRPSNFSENKSKNAIQIRPTDAEKKQLKIDKQTYRIPPGALLIFFEHIYHTIANPSLGNPRKRFPMMRLFIGWRLNPTDGTPLIKNLKESFLDKGKALPLKGTQESYHYGSRQQQYFPQMLAKDLNPKFHPELLTEGQGGKHMLVKRPPRDVHSLRDLLDKKVIDEDTFRKFLANNTAYERFLQPENIKNRHEQKENAVFELPSVEEWGEDERNRAEEEEEKRTRRRKQEERRTRSPMVPRGGRKKGRTWIPGSSRDRSQGRSRSRSRSVATRNRVSVPEFLKITQGSSSSSGAATPTAATQAPTKRPTKRWKSGLLE